MSRLTVVSPHLDDAAFSCGSLIAAVRLVVPVTVVSVFAGLPDGNAGAVEERRREDIAACEILGCEYLHLDVLDGAYDARPHEERVDSIREALGEIVGLAGVVLGPWGIRHADHVAVAEALTGHIDFVYEELPYRVLWSEYLPHPLPSPMLVLPTSSIKQTAIRCYASQLGGPAGEALYAAEHYHRAVDVKR